jgi:hypothetical protein
MLRRNHSVLIFADVADLKEAGLELPGQCTIERIIKKDDLTSKDLENILSHTHYGGRNAVKILFN